MRSLNWLVASGNCGTNGKAQAPCPTKQCLPLIVLDAPIGCGNGETLSVPHKPGIHKHTGIWVLTAHPNSVFASGLGWGAPESQSNHRQHTSRLLSSLPITTYQFRQFLSCCFYGPTQKTTTLTENQNTMVKLIFNV